MTQPVRLRLSRKKGFDLQELSIATNGLPAVNVSRPSRFGNPFTFDAAMNAGYLKSKTETLAGLFLADCFSEWLADPSSNRWWMGNESDATREAILKALPTIAGKNLACWCPSGDGCHADVLLRLANRPVCEEAA